MGGHTQADPQFECPGPYTGTPWGRTKGASGGPMCATHVMSDAGGVTESAGRHQGHQANPPQSHRRTDANAHTYTCVLCTHTCVLWTCTAATQGAMAAGKLWPTQANKAPTGKQTVAHISA
jgi:hypothetical protein